MVEESKVERAIKIIEDCRQSHVDWAEFQESNSEGWVKEVEPTDVGDAEHHRTWIANYDEVLEVLREIS